MGSKRKASNVSIKLFRKVGYNKSFFSSNKQRGDVSIIALERGFLEKNVMEYNTKVASSQAKEKANFARIQGKLARMEGRQAQIGYLSQAGTSLLRTV